jgi:hypothetical protein
MIKRFNFMLECFDYLIVDWVVFFMPEFIVCMIESCLDDSVTESEPEQIVALRKTADIDNNSDIITHFVIKNNEEFFDFSLN